MMMDILSLPVVMIEHIISYLSYDEIAKYRLVSKAFNEICMRMLNRGFLMIERQHGHALKSVKAQLPRRESERRYHPLSRHCDILTSIETRISMLNMTYSKFIDSGMCCFIPGRVIDEIKRVLTLVEASSSPPRAHEVLQELRDISSMAIEHFDDKISPAFRKRMQEGVPPPPSARPQHVQTVVLAPFVMRQEMLNLRKRSIVNTKLSLCLAYQYKRFYKRVVHYRKVVWKQQNVIRVLMRKQKEQDAAIADLKKRIEECDIKYNELTHTNQAAGGKTISSSSTGEVTTQPQQPLRHFSSQIKLDLSVLPIGTSKRGPNKLLPNIKPRKPVINLPSLSEDDSEPAPKIPKTDNTNNRFSPIPSTSHGNSPKLKSQATLAKIRGITSEIRHLSNLSKTFEVKFKRPFNLNAADVAVPEKKQKLD